MVSRFDWQKHAACANPDYDPEWWFLPPCTAGGHTAINICITECPVRDQCERYRQTVDTQITGGAAGIWAGKAHTGYVARPNNKRRTTKSI